ncbi:hypothetical protein LMG31841_02943 [Paraburkholderia saeva]|uniref:Uncharacterized protein n=2 Tax=Paraburkholderia saeva TaxID=2777537 RepID=A0A9N8RW97_9BURK|nr:hypothetical protein LMG31841_02943 [Paraburkholderia saeva]
MSAMPLPPHAAPVPCYNCTAVARLDAMAIRDGEVLHRCPHMNVKILIVKRDGVIVAQSYSKPWTQADHDAAVTAAAADESQHAEHTKLKFR